MTREEIIAAIGVATGRRDATTMLVELAPDVFAALALAARRDGLAPTAAALAGRLLTETVRGGLIAAVLDGGGEG